MSYDLRGEAPSVAEARTLEAKIEEAAAQVTERLARDLSGDPLETLERLRQLTPNRIADLTQGFVGEAGAALGVDAAAIEASGRAARTVLVYDTTGAPVRGGHVGGDVPTLTAQALLRTLPADLVEALHDLLADAGGMPRVFEAAAERLPYAKIDAAHVLAVAKLEHPARAEAIDATVARWARD